MEKIRIGNDIDILWSITAVSSGTEFPYDLSGRSLTLYLKNAFGKEEIKDYTIEGGSLRFRYYGKDQKKAGRYSLILVENAYHVVTNIDTELQLNATIVSLCCNSVSVRFYEYVLIAVIPPSDVITLLRSLIIA